MTTWSIIFCIIVLSALQINRADRIAGFILSVTAFVVYGVGSYIPGYIYFHFCGAVDLLTVFLILRVRSNLSYPLSMVLFISILLNLMGFILWYDYMPDTIYVNSFGVYFSLTLYLLLSRGKIGWNYSRQSLDSSECSFSHGQE